MRYQIAKGSKSYGSQDVFENIVFEIKDKQKVAIVGRNGCGKSTLLKVIAGIEDLDGGQIHKEKQCEIQYLAQTIFMDEEISVEAEFEKVFEEIHKYELQLKQLEQKMLHEHSESLLNEYAKMQSAFEELGGYTYKQEMMLIFTKFGFTKEDLKKPISQFSGGQKTRLAFVKLLVSKPDILLLDEPTNHLDLQTIQWLEGYIKNYSKAVVMVSHDRTFLDNVVDVVYEIEYGIMRKYTGNYTNYVDVKRNDVERNKSAFARQQKEIAQLEEMIEKFRYKASKAKFAQSKIKYLDRMDRVQDRSVDERSFHATFRSNIKGGNQVLQVKDLQVGYEYPLCTINLEILRGQRIAIVGENGTGKSTFIKTLMEKIEPLSGAYLFGHQIETSYFDQELAQFSSHKSVLEELWSLFPDYDHSEIRSALGSFLFRGEEVFKEVSVLSGGEKVRLTLAKIMLEHANFLLMDEPTNHLDIIGKEALEESIKQYDGTMLFVSHDRYFISQIATGVLELKEGVATYYPLTYNEYKEKQAQKETTREQVVKNKEKPKYINYGREVSRLEKQIEKIEIEIAQQSQLRFDPCYYEDHTKMQQLDAHIAMLEMQLDEFVCKWEEYSEQL